MIIYYIVPHTFLFDFDCDQIHHTDLWKRLTGSIWSPKTIDWRQKKCLHVFDSFPGECLWFQKFEWLPSGWIRSRWSLKKINCDQINLIDLWKRSTMIEAITSINDQINLLITKNDWFKKPMIEFPSLQNWPVSGEQIIETLSYHFDQQATQ